eukprot:s2690_g8.t1
MSAPVQPISEFVSDPPCTAIELPASQGTNERSSFDINAPAFVPRPPPLQTWDAFTQHLFAVWQSQAFSWAEEAESAIFLTWYLAPGSGRISCLYSRRVTLYEDFWNWKQQLQAKWIDVLQPDVDIHFHVVLPQPAVLEHGIAGHLFLVQNPLLEFVASLVTLTDHAIHAGRPFKQAHALPVRPTSADVLTATNYAYDCTRIARCTVVVQGQQLSPDLAFVGFDGVSFDVAIQRGILPPTWRPPAQPHPPGAEGFSLLQHSVKLFSPSLARSFVSGNFSSGCLPLQHSLTDEFLRTVRAAEQAQDQEAVIPDPTALESQSPFVQELWGFWHDVSMQDPATDEPVFRVETWFVDHVRFDRCYHPRNVQLFRDFLGWETTLLAAWADRTLLGATTQFAIVYPTPEDIAPTADLQIIILQQPSEAKRSIVLSVYDSDPEVDPLRTFCLTVSPTINMAALLDVLHLTASCPPVTTHNECLLWYGTIPVHDHRYIQVRTGNAFRLVIRRGRPIDIPTLLAMSDHRLRSELQEAIDGVIYRRPRGPAFLAGMSARSAPSTSPDPHVVADRRPAWLVSMDTIFQAHSFVEMQEEGPVCYVLTWFLHGDRTHRCRDPRVARLNHLSFQWRGELVRQWTDQLQADVPVEFWVVKPSPPQSVWESHIAHIILTQQVLDTQRPVLLSVQIQDPQEALLDHIAALVPDTVPLTVLHELIVPSFVRHRPYQARQDACVFSAGQEVPLQPGDSLTFDVQPASASNHSSSPSVHGLNLLQRSARVKSRLIPARIDMPGQVYVWFLSDTLIHSQPARLLSSCDADALLPAAAHLWNDSITDFAHLAIWPLHRLTDSSDHAFILTQNDRVGHVPVLITTEVVSAADASAISYVKWSPCSLDILGVLSLAAIPTDSPLQPIDCLINGQTVSTSQAVQVPSGSRISVRLHQVILASRSLSIDFSRVFRVHEWLDNHFFLPQYDIPSDFPLFPSSRVWTDDWWWTPGIPGSELRIYYDGSKLHRFDDGSPSAGAAVAAFVLTADGWAFAGALSTSLPQSTTSYTAELSASAIAYKFAYDLVKLLAPCGHSGLRVSFWFDALTVGKQSEGTWQTCACKHLGTFVRCMHRWLEAAFAPWLDLSHTHVRAHRGEPGNELVDALAFSAAQGQALHDLQGWLTFVTDPQFVGAADWLWFLQRTDVHWDGSDLLFPCAPQSVPSVSALPRLTPDAPDEDHPQQGRLDFQLATCNVLSLCPSHDREIFFEEPHFAVIASDPRFLLLRVHNALLKCIVIAAHGPHSGHSKAVIDQWWSDLGASIPSNYDLWDRILLTDANSRVGAEPCSSIGPFQSDQASSHTSEGFVNFVRAQGLMLPATFANYQQGDGATWRHSSGSWSRIDYVGIPAAWTLDECSARICMDVDPSLCKEDHRVPVVHVRRSFRPFGKPSGVPSFKLRLTEVDPAAFDTVELPSWSVDVHSHAMMLQANMVDTLWGYRAARRPHKIRTTMSDQTWQLVCDKRHTRSTLSDLNRIHRRTFLSAWFSQWRHCVHQVDHFPLQVAFDALLSQQDRLIAWHYHRFRDLGRQVCRALRADDVHFYADLLTDGVPFLHPFDAKRLWNVVRRSLPKAVQRRLAPNPFQLERLEDQWSPHFQTLEFGQPTEPARLTQQCVVRQAIASLSAPDRIDLATIPSITQLETALRATQCDKATGYDPLPSSLFHRYPAALAKTYFDLVFKEYCWQMEPLAHKGGAMALIPKKLTPQQAKDFRGILLLENLPKRVHALLRSQVMRHLHPCRSPGQLGGFIGQEVLFGSMAIRTFGRLADKHSLSSAILFLDLASAFHHLIRETVVGCPSSDALHDLLSALARDGMPTTKLAAIAQLPNLLQQLGMPEPLIRLLRDIHYDTWCTFGSCHLLRTRRGTRPGSPLADVVFHVLMSRVGHAIDDWRQQQPDAPALFSAIGGDVPTILWADDIAVPVLSSSASRLVPLVQSLLRFVHGTLRDLGFSLNLALGKTTAVLSFQGCDAAHARQHFQFEDGSGVWCDLTGDSRVWLHFASSYKHLGTIFSSSHTMQQEVAVRVGTAKHAFVHLSRPLLTNRHFPTRLRLQLFHALITTKLTFGLAWRLQRCPWDNLFNKRQCFP